MMAAVESANVSNSKASSGWEANVGSSLEISFIVVSLVVHHLLFAHIRSFIRWSHQYSLEYLCPKIHTLVIDFFSLVLGKLGPTVWGPICLEPFALYLPSKCPLKEKATASLVRFPNPFAFLTAKFRKKPEGRKTALAGTTIFTSQVRTGFRDLLQTICNSPLKIFTHS